MQKSKRKMRKHIFVEICDTVRQRSIIMRIGTISETLVQRMNSSMY